MAVTAVAVTAQCWMLLMTPSYTAILIAMMFSGGAIGGTYPLGMAMFARRFGAPSVGTVSGLMLPLQSISAMTALYFIGAVHDRTNSYLFAFLTFGILAFLALCMIPLMPKTSPPMQFNT